MDAPAPAQASFVDARLADYREAVTRYMLAAIPDREPRKYLYQILSDHLSNQGKGIRPALCLATPREVGWLQALMRSRGSIDYARQAARQLADSARRELAVAYAGASSGPDLDMLTALVEYVVTREV